MPNDGECALHIVTNEHLVAEIAEHLMHKFLLRIRYASLLLELD